MHVNWAPVSLSVVRERTFTWPSITMQISLDSYRHVKNSENPTMCSLFVPSFVYVLNGANEDYVMLQMILVSLKLHFTCLFD